MYSLYRADVESTRARIDGEPIRPPPSATGVQPQERVEYVREGESAGDRPSVSTKKAQTRGDCRENCGMTHLHTFVLPAALLMVGGCGHGIRSRDIVLPDGSRGEAISCAGPRQTAADCLAKAGDLCPYGYDVVAAGNEAHPYAYSGASVGAYGGFGSTQRGVDVQRSLIVKCH